jgi:hypothetical protein
MSLRVYNAPDVERIQTADLFRVSGANRDRNYSHRYNTSQSFLGTDALQLSDDYGYGYASTKTRTRNQSSSYGYGNLIRLLLIFFAIAALIVTGLVVLVALGGLISLVVAALVLFFSVFLYSINLNPFDKGTYKKVRTYLY